MIVSECWTAGCAYRKRSAMRTRSGSDIVLYYHHAKCLLDGKDRKDVIVGLGSGTEVVMTKGFITRTVTRIM